MKKNFFIGLIFGVTITVLANTFLYQVVDGLSSSWLENEVERESILNANLQSGENITSRALNAKFNAFKKEIDNLKIQVSGLSGGSTIISNLGCSKYCYFIINGIAEGEASARNFLVSVDNFSAEIVHRVWNASGTTDYSYSFDIDGDGAYDTV